MKVRTYVHVRSVDGTHSAVLRPGDTVPDWAEVSNKDALDASTEPVDEVPAPVVATPVADAPVVEAPVVEAPAAPAPAPKTSGRRKAAAPKADEAPAQ
ncbi:hypothetical protein JNUCC0626_18175 [Lentzea sp. JNUCC 0626]|uniref:hypothetical protein n=1 Tax=Lentzea sp. JNUCC 0626 TaxID=3367513 RepID=UPI0037479EDA